MRTRRWARWLPLLPIALLVGVVLTPPPDDYAFLGEGEAPIPLASINEAIQEWWRIYPMRDERDRAWRVKPSFTEISRQIRARFPECDYSGTTISEESSPGKKPRFLAQTTLYRNPDTGAILILAEKLKDDRRTVVVREPRGASALPGRLLSLLRRTFRR